MQSAQSILRKKKKKNELMETQQKPKAVISWLVSSLSGIVQSEILQHWNFAPVLRNILNAHL